MRALAVAAMLLLGGPALAQQPITGAPPLRLEMTTEQAMLIVQTLGAISCPNVTQLAICQQAVELLKSLREQIKGQGQ